MSPVLSLPMTACQLAAAAAEREAAEIKRLVDMSGNRVGQSSPCSCNPLVSLWPSISTLPFVVEPHLWSDRSLSAPLGSFETVLFPTLMLFVMSKNTSNCTFLVPQHCLLLPVSLSSLLNSFNGQLESTHSYQPSYSKFFSHFCQSVLLECAKTQSNLGQIWFLFKCTIVVTWKMWVYYSITHHKEGLYLSGGTIRLIKCFVQHKKISWVFFFTIRRK